MPPDPDDGSARTVVRRGLRCRRFLVRTALWLAAGAFLAACTAISSNDGLPAIPTLGHGGSAGSAAAPAIAVPSPGAVEYRVEGPLPSVADHAVVYRAGATTTTAAVTRLAAAFGLSGTVQTDATGWTVADASEQLRVERAGGLPWTLSSSGGGSVSSGCAVAVPGSPGGAPSTSSVAQPTCPPTTTVPGLPDEQGAEQRARDVLARAAVDVSGATVDASGGGDAWTVTFSPVLDGLAVLGATTSVTVGAQGSIVSASGHLAPPAPVGTYPLVGVAAGLDRLRQGWDWIVYGGPVPLAAQGGVAPRSTGAPAVGSPPVGAPGSTPPASGLPLPTAPSTTETPTIVKVTGVHLALSWAWPMATPSDEAWLVPVYVFELGPGSPYFFLSAGVPVLAVADAYVTATTTTTAPSGSAVPGSPPANS